MWLCQKETHDSTEETKYPKSSHLTGALTLRRKPIQWFFCLIVHIIIYILYWLWVLAEPAVTCEVPGLTELVPPRLGVVQAVDVGDEGHLGDQTWTPRDNEDKSSWYFSTYQAVSLWSPLLRVFCPESKALCYIVLHCIITLYYIHSLAFLIV